MSKIKIATDSTADIPKSFCEELNISVLPLTILADEKEYRDSVDITPAEFYKIIDASKKLPMSSQVSSILYGELFEETWKAGYTDLIQVTLNSKGSGTYQSAVLSRNLFYEEHSEAKEHFSIHIIDSKTYSMGYGIPVIEGAQLAKVGASVHEVIDHIEEWLVHSRPVFVALDLRCVKKSGRVSPAAALVKRCMKERRPNTNYVIVYGYNTEALEFLKEVCTEVMDKPPIAEYQVGCVISINTGPNMIGILYRT